MNLRGTILPVVHLAKLFGLNSAGGDYSPVLVVESLGSLVGFLVERADEVIDINAEDIRAVSSDHSVNECAAGEFTANGQVCVLLDATRLLLNEERQRIAAMRTQVQQRMDAAAHT